MSEQEHPASAASRQPGANAPGRRPAGFLHALFSVFFPDRCHVCDEPLAEIGRAPVCRGCLEALRPLRAGAGLCGCCGIPRDAVVGDVCERCASGDYDFAQARSYGAYDGALREVIHLLKYRGMRPLAGPLAERMAGVVEQERWREAGFHGLVAVPLSPERLRERGFNQAELLARKLARRMRLPVLNDVCRRARVTAPQTGLTRAQRFENMRGAFAPGPGAARVAGRDLLLIDDVLTTGATLSACARALHRAGARRVSALTAARTLAGS